jgi:hypothetical protein
VKIDAMSDIFISYAKVDHALALKLSAFPEAEGWSVWWDRSLGAAAGYAKQEGKRGIDPMVPPPSNLG